MGIFSSEYETYVGTSVSRVIKDKQLPDSPVTGAIKALFNGGNIPEYIIEELVSGVGVRADRMYDYAAQHYTHGMPSGQVFSSTQGKAQIQVILDALEGSPVLLDYCQYGQANHMHMAWMRLIADHGYNTTTNQLGVLTASIGRPVYLSGMHLVVPDAMLAILSHNSMEQWGTPASAGYTPASPVNTGAVRFLNKKDAVYSDPVATEIKIKVTYSYETAGSQLPNGLYTVLKELKTGEFTITPAGYIASADYFHAKYEVGGSIKYQMYRAGAGAYPTLDALFHSPEIATGSYFPFIYFRFNKASTSVDKTSLAYKSSVKLVKYLGMDYEMVASAINQNPQIADVEQAMLVMAVPAKTADLVEMRYLYEYFDVQYYDADVEYESAIAAQISLMFNSAGKPPQSTVVIQDKQFKMALSNSGIYKKRVAGTIGAIDSYASGTSVALINLPFTDSLGVSSELPQEVATHYYRKQIGIGIYDEIEVINLNMMYQIWERYTTTGAGVDNILLIPIDRAITDAFSPSVREVLYSRSLHYVFNSRTIVETKWYQQTWFQNIILVVAFAITMWWWLRSASCVQSLMH